MKIFLCLPVLFAAHAFADETSERMAIGRAITTLNEPSQIGALFTGDGRTEFEELRKASPLAFRVIGPAADPTPMDRPTVSISREPFGEATINFQKPRPSIALITADVALAEGACTSENDRGNRQTTPLLFVMKKLGDDWKIASIRVLAR